MTDPKTPDQVLSEQAEPVPAIEFAAGGKTVKLELPFRKPVWFWILTHPVAGIDPNQDGQTVLEGVVACIALNAERILSVATGIPLDVLKSSVAADDLKRVCDELAEQLGREMRASDPFSEFRSALQAVQRMGLFARGAKGSTGRQPSSVSRRKSAAGRRKH